jgi:hypothetical protein
MTPSPWKAKAPPFGGEHLPDPVQMQPKWVSQMALRPQPIGERFQFGAKT